MRLTTEDQRMLDGGCGEAARFAATVVVRMAEATGAEGLLSVEQAHIDACALMSRSSLDLVSHLADHGGRVAVPTTLSMISVDLEHWERLAIDRKYAEMATEIALAYRRLGGIPTWTCAPYQGYLTPRFGQQIAWGESNAVAYANSVLGARTNRYPDYLDICAAIMGRVPDTGLHRVENRRATVAITVDVDDPSAWRTPAAWAALGASVGRIAEDEVPVIDGLAGIRPSNDMLKALGAAAASSGAVGLFHLPGVTPEADSVIAACHGRDPKRSCRIAAEQLAASWEELGGLEEGDPVKVVILGCPHFSYAEFEALARCVADQRRRIHDTVRCLVFASSPTIELARRGDLLEPLAAFGVTVVRDSCPFYAPVIRPSVERVVTNSGKCAYYAPAELDVDVGFADLEGCVETAISGAYRRGIRPW